MGIYLVSPKMHCRFMRFGFLLCKGSLLLSVRVFAFNCDLQQVRTTPIFVKLASWELAINKSCILQSVKHLKDVFCFFILFFFQILHPPHFSTTSQVGIFQECFCRSVECRQDGACLWFSRSLQNMSCAN